MSDILLFSPVSFVCLQCGYNQDTSPYDAWQQSPDMFPTVPLGKCPNCYVHGDITPMTKSSDTEEGSKTSIQVASDADLELKEIEELDANGRPIMVESGEYIDKLINDNGTPRFIQEPVMVPKMVPLAKGEVDKLRLQRNQSLNELEKVAVNQV